MNFEEIVAALKADDFQVDRCDEELHGHKITLGCRLIVCVYKSGKIVVQGKYDAQWGAESLEHLIPLLPPNTMWNVTVAIKEPFKSMIAQRKVAAGKR
jgi:hypothetical protein